LRIDLGVAGDRLGKGEPGEGERLRAFGDGGPFSARTEGQLEEVGEGGRGAGLGEPRVIGRECFAKAGSAGGDERDFSHEGFDREKAESLEPGGHQHEVEVGEVRIQILDRRAQFDGPIGRGVAGEIAEVVGEIAVTGDGQGAGGKPRGGEMREYFREEVGALLIIEARGKEETQRRADRGSGKVGRGNDPVVDDAGAARCGRVAARTGVRFKCGQRVVRDADDMGRRQTPMGPTADRAPVVPVAGVVNRADDGNRFQAGTEREGDGVGGFGDFGVKMDDVGANAIDGAEQRKSAGEKTAEFDGKAGAGMV